MTQATSITSNKYQPPGRNNNSMPHNMKHLVSLLIICPSPIVGIRAAWVRAMWHSSDVILVVMQRQMWRRLLVVGVMATSVAEVSSTAHHGN